MQDWTGTPTWCRSRHQVWEACGTLAVDVCQLHVPFGCGCVSFMSHLAVDVCQLHVPFGCGCVSASCPIWLLMNIELHVLWFLVNLISPLLWLFVDIPHTKQCQSPTTVRTECATTNMPNDFFKLFTGNRFMPVPQIISVPQSRFQIFLFCTPQTPCHPLPNTFILCTHMRVCVEGTQH